MSDERDDPKLFSLTEAERTRLEVEPLLIEAMEGRRKLHDLTESLAGISSGIQLLGGSIPPYRRAVSMRLEHDRLAESVRDVLERIEATGCVVKDLDTGLLDFPAILNDEEVYYCWKLGEDRIRFYHRQDEGFAGRKPLDPRDRGPGTVQ
ncbi:MAG: DUF2203 domain-containing protein [Acidobacteria bacterium]|nr:DUF2203 domain-containing protein [Acidobacteriota bacterium]MCL5288164.1 DUF2203 domain-containing protein [Acidobacteriota bacterium]